MRKIIKIALALLLTYSILLVGFFIVMCQPPEAFCRIIAKTPSVVFMILPFKTMWLYARKGELEVGDEAPDFSLETYDKKSKVQLSAFRGNKPVVLVFGSYT